MGRTAVAALLTPCVGEVTLHLDGQALQIRGVLRRDVPRSALRDIVEQEGVLSFAWTRPAGEAETVRLDLGGAASRWAALLAKPAPTLREKLGIRAGEGVFVVGTMPPLVEAATDGCRTDLGGAAQVVATVRTSADLNTLLHWLRADEVALPVWVVHGKVGSSAPGGDAVRGEFRAAGYRDVKITAVSDSWSATSYRLMDRPAD